MFDKHEYRTDYKPLNLERTKDRWAMDEILEDTFETDLRGLEERQFGLDVLLVYAFRSNREHINIIFFPLFSQTFAVVTFSKI